ncbi:MAG: GNAT family N-acetyltransferase [Sphingomonadales bacterium 17-56-6]|nr:MAG: GNAT family N-acetyltransferase [Sphingomonadales bacterium 28-55-16]OYZ89032.1 MAG: GNAT family N-acetyltransferase [Sphingomonadales bacterium 17-56-6]
MRIIEDDLTGIEIRALLETHFAGMLASSPAESCHFLDFDGLNAPDVTFWSIWDAGTLAGCGALKALSSTQGEIKSMRTHADHLRKGVGAAMLKHIISVARQRSYVRLSLETGSSDVFLPARALYEAYGFTYCPPFGDYAADPFSCFMTLAI